MSEHARLSPSAAHRWIHCPGSLRLEEQVRRATGEDHGSEYAREGTAAHELGQWTLEAPSKQCSDFIGSETANGYTVTRDMARDTQIYVDQIRDYADGHTLYVERRVDYSTVVDVPYSFGTADAIIITADGKELQIHDLKFGRGVQVDAEENEQLMIYALGALAEYGLVYDFDRVRLVIHQPRLHHLSEWECQTKHLVEFSKTLRRAAKRAIIYADIGPDDSRLGSEPVLNPGEKQCRFCKGAADCGALEKAVEEALGSDFENLDALEAQTLLPDDGDTISLSQKMKAIDLVETWCKAVRAKTERVLFSGEAVPGFKLVQGKMGNRAWLDEEEVEKAFKAMRLKAEEKYNFKLISPTDAEKLLKSTPRRWSKVQPLITRSPGKPSVAPESDKRPALSLDNEFEALPAEPTQLHA